MITRSLTTLILYAPSTTAGLRHANNRVNAKDDLAQETEAGIAELQARADLSEPKI